MDFLMFKRGTFKTKTRKSYVMQKIITACYTQRLSLQISKKANKRQTHRRLLKMVPIEAGSEFSAVTWSIKDHRGWR